MTQPVQTAQDFWRDYYKADQNFPPSDAACKFAEAYYQYRASLAPSPPSGVEPAKGMCDSSYHARFRKLARTSHLR